MPALALDAQSEIKVDKGVAQEIECECAEAHGYVFVPKRTPACLAYMTSVQPIVNQRQQPVADVQRLYKYRCRHVRHISIKGAIGAVTYTGWWHKLTTLYYTTLALNA
eukprot:5730-Heterococcus_DN1.PRE.3